MIKYAKICDNCGRFICVLERDESNSTETEHICIDCQSRSYNVSYSDENGTYKKRIVRF